MIIEDDPYYFLQMPQYAPKEVRKTRVSPFDTDGDSYLRTLVPSYLKQVMLSSTRYSLLIISVAIGSIGRGE